MVCRSMGEGGCADDRSCFLVIKVTGRSFAILAQGTWSYGLLVVPLPFWLKERGAMHPCHLGTRDPLPRHESRDMIQLVSIFYIHVRLCFCIPVCGCSHI